MQIKKVSSNLNSLKPLGDPIQSGYVLSFSSLHTREEGSETLSNLPEVTGPLSEESHSLPIGTQALWPQREAGLPALCVRASRRRSGFRTTMFGAGLCPFASVTSHKLPEDGTELRGAQAPPRVPGVQTLTIILGQSHISPPNAAFTLWTELLRRSSSLKRSVAGAQTTLEGASALSWPLVHWPSPGQGPAGINTRSKGRDVPSA